MNGLYSFFIYTPILLGFFNSVSETPLKSKMVEICDNGIDDDMDGLIDLNDVDDCNCSNSIPGTDFLNIIPNSSFEDTIRCPHGHAVEESIYNWEHGGNGFYTNTCSDFFPNIGVPVPLPDGSGITFYAPGTRSMLPGLTAGYLGTCLNQPLQKDSLYNFKFNFGFGGLEDRQSRPSTEFSIYGYPDCSGMISSGTNCITVLNWLELGTISPSGSNEWVSDSIIFSPPINIAKIALGASCTSEDSASLYFLDNLKLGLLSGLNNAYAKMNVSVNCQYIYLQISDYDSNSNYQWYRDGIALVDSTGEQMTLHNDNGGNYQLAIFSDGGCAVSDIFTYNPEGYVIPDVQLDTMICQGERLAVGSDVYTENGQYSSILSSIDGCDSMVSVNLTVLDTFYHEVNRSICLGDQYELAGNLYNQSGNYSATMTGSNGCDSSVFLTLSIVDTIIEDISALICPGDEYRVHDVIFIQSGYYQVPLLSNSGCDSLVRLSLIVRDTNTTHLLDTICDGDNYIINGQEFINTGNYQVNLQNEWGCDSTILLDLTVMPQLMGVINIIEPISCHGSQVGSIELMLDNNSYSSILWNTGDTIKQLSDLGPGYYEVTVTDHSNCSSVFSIILDEPMPLSFQVEGTNLDCDHDQGNIHIIETSGGSQPYTYYLDGVGITDFDVLNNLPEGIYQVSIRDQNSCTSDTLIEIRDLRGVGSLELSADVTTAILGDTVLLLARLTDILEPYLISWSGPNIRCSDCLKQAIVPPFGQQTYSILITDANGCTYDASVDIHIDAGYYIPNAFTPNGDGTNDYFTVYTEDYIERINYMQIYNRYGDLIYNGVDFPPNQPDQGWDGSYDGHYVDTGVYIYVIQARDRIGNSIQVSGDVTLLR